MQFTHAGSSVFVTEIEAYPVWVGFFCICAATAGGAGAFGTAGADEIRITRNVKTNRSYGIKVMFFDSQ